MWRQAASLLVIAQLAIAQQVQSPSRPPLPTESKQWIPVQNLSFYKRYRQLRQGTSEKLLIEIGDSLVRNPAGPSQIIFFPKGGGDLGRNYLIAGGTPEIQTTPVKIEFGPVEGLTIRLSRSPSSHERRFPFTSGPIKVFEPGKEWFSFEVTAAPNATLGDHTIRAKLDFQFVNASGVSLPQSVELDIPITVVTHNAKAKRETWPGHIEETPVIWYVALAPLMVATLPLWIVIGLICTVEGNCRDWTC